MITKDLRVGLMVIFLEHLQVEEDKVVMTTIQDHQIISLG